MKPKTREFCKGVENADMLGILSGYLNLASCKLGLAEGNGICTGEFRLRHVKLPHIKLAVFGDELAGIKGYFKAV